MQKKLLFIFMICFCSLAKSQNTFEKVIDTLGSAGATCIQETFDGGYVFAGSSTLAVNYVLITKVDSIGTIEWIKGYTGAGFDNLTYIEQTTDSGYIVNGSHDIGPNTKSWLLRLDANGDTLWTKTFSAGVGATQPSNGNSMAIYNSSIYGLIGNYKKPNPFSVHAYFIGTLNNGTFLTTKLYDTTYYQTEASAISRTNNGFIIGGVSSPGGLISDSYLIRTDAYGDTLWTKTYDYNSNIESITAVEQTVDSGFILTGLFSNASIGNNLNVFLIKTDANGDTLWAKFYWQNHEEVCWAVQQTADGGYIIAGSRIDSLNVGYNVLLIKADTAGSITWTRQFGGVQSDYGLYVKQTKDGGYIVCGLNNSVGTGGTYLIKTDSMGNVLTGLDNPELNNQINLVVFPNPATDLITVRAKNISQKKSMLALYNLTGQCFYTENLNNNETKKVDVRNFAGGIYTLILTSGNERVIKKIAIYK